MGGREPAELASVTILPRYSIRFFSSECKYFISVKLSFNAMNLTNIY